MPRSKGTNFNNLKSWIETRHGEDAWARVLAAMPGGDPVRLQAIVAVGWYELELQNRLLHAAVDTIGGGDPQVLADYGRFDAERDLTGPQRLFLRFGNPAYVLEKAGDYWRRFYDPGEWKVLREPDGATGTLAGFDAGDEIFCIPLTSYIGRMFELVGARDVRMQHTKCHARGDGSCVFVARWR